MSPAEKELKDKVIGRDTVCAPATRMDAGFVVQAVDREMEELRAGRRGSRILDRVSVSRREHCRCRWFYVGEIGGEWETGGVLLGA